MHPDDDSMDLYEPYDGPDRRTTGIRQQSHCSEHSGNMEFYKSVNMKLNLCVGGVMTMLASMAWLLLAQIDSGKLAVSHTELLRSHAFEISELRKEMAVVKQQQLENTQFRSAWEMRESFQHGTGIEKHHVENIK